MHARAHECVVATQASVVHREPVGARRLCEGPDRPVRAWRVRRDHRAAVEVRECARQRRRGRACGVLLGYYRMCLCEPIGIDGVGETPEALVHPTAALPCCAALPIFARAARMHRQEPSEAALHANALAARGRLCTVCAATSAAWARCSRISCRSARTHSATSCACRPTFASASTTRSTGGAGRKRSPLRARASLRCAMHPEWIPLGGWALLVQCESLRLELTTSRFGRRARHCTACSCAPPSVTCSSRTSVAV